MKPIFKHVAGREDIEYLVYQYPGSLQYHANYSTIGIWTLTKAGNHPEVPALVMLEYQGMALEPKTTQRSIPFEFLKVLPAHLFTGIHDSVKREELREQV